VNAVEAISAVVEYVRTAGLDYGTEGLEADRFNAGWSVYATTVDVGDVQESLTDVRDSS
jgi:hypothetical protein